MSDSKGLYGGQFTSTHLMKRIVNLLVLPPLPHPLGHSTISLKQLDNTYNIVTTADHFERNP